MMYFLKVSCDNVVKYCLKNSGPTYDERSAKLWVSPSEHDTEGRTPLQRVSFKSLVVIGQLHG